MSYDEFTDYETEETFGIGEKSRKPRVTPEGRRYPRGRSTVSTKAFAFHLDEFIPALGSIKKIGGRLGEPFEGAGRGMKRKGPQSGFTLGDRVKGMASNIKLKDDFISCYVTGFETPERRQTYRPQTPQERFSDAPVRKQEGISPETIRAIRGEEHKKKEQRPLTAFETFATDKGFDWGTFVPDFAKEERRYCDGCHKDGRPSSWSNYCEECTNKDVDSTMGNDNNNNNNNEASHRGTAEDYEDGDEE